MGPGHGGVVNPGAPRGSETVHRSGRRLPSRRPGRDTGRRPGATPPPSDPPADGTGCDGAGVRRGRRPGVGRILQLRVAIRGGAGEPEGVLLFRPSSRGGRLGFRGEGPGTQGVVWPPHAGVVQRQNTSFPSSERGFDSRRPLSLPSALTLDLRCTTTCAALCPRPRRRLQLDDECYSFKKWLILLSALALMFSLTAGSAQVARMEPCRRRCQRSRRCGTVGGNREGRASRPPKNRARDGRDQVIRERSPH